MLVDEANRTGGIAGRKVELILKDSQGSAEKAVSFAKQLIEEDEVLAIIGPSTSGESMKLKGLCNESETILFSCAAAETIVNPVANGSSRSRQMDSFAAQTIFATMKKLGIQRIGVVVQQPGLRPGRQGAAREARARRTGSPSPSPRSTTRTATDLTGVLTKMKATERAGRGELVHGAGAVHRAQEHEAARASTFPCSRATASGTSPTWRRPARPRKGSSSPAGRILVADALPAGHPQKKLLIAYKKAYEAKFNEEPSTFGGHAYDAFGILAEAVAKAGHGQVQGAGRH